MNKHIDIIRTNTDDMVVLAECNLLEKEIKETIKQVKEILDCTYLYDKENVNLIDRLELISKALRGEDNGNN